MATFLFILNPSSDKEPEHYYSQGLTPLDCLYDPLTDRFVNDRAKGICNAFGFFAKHQVHTDNFEEEFQVDRETAEEMWMIRHDKYKIMNDIMLTAYLEGGDSHDVWCFELKHIQEK